MRSLSRPRLNLNPNETQDFSPIPDPPVQTALFGRFDQKVIPFDSWHGQSSRKVIDPTPPPAKPARPVAKARSAFEQASLEFVSAAPPQRVLKTDVPAQIYCNRPVATPTHRLVAGAMDAAMVFMGFGLFVGICELTGTGLGSGKIFWGLLAVAFALIAVFYGLVFAITGRETAGMNWTDLQLVTFDGFPVDGRARAARVASTWLSFCSGGLGLVWALADEETLTWQDHISKTFPTIRETSGSFVQQSRGQAAPARR